MPEIIAIGECMIELFSDQPLGEAPMFHKSFAGDTLNALLMASTLGTNCGYITKLGEDHFTEYLLREMKDHNIDITQVKRVRGFTGFHFAALLPGGDREFVYYRKGSAASTMHPDELNVEYIAKAKLLHISAVAQAISKGSRDTVLRAVQIAKKSGVIVSYDTNLRLNMWTVEEAKESMADILPYVDIIFPSHPDDTSPLIGDVCKEEVVDFFLTKGVKTVVVKCGELGALIGTNDSRFALRSFAPLGVIDTTGAGDAFAGGFLHGLVQGMKLSDAARYGVVSAGLKIAGRGAISSQPSRQEVEKFLHEVQVIESSR